MKMDDKYEPNKLSLKTCDYYKCFGEEPDHEKEKKLDDKKEEELDYLPLLVMKK